MLRILTVLQRPYSRNFKLKGYNQFALVQNFNTFQVNLNLTKIGGEMLI